VRAGVLAAARDTQLLAGDPDFLQELEHVRRHAFGQVDEAVIVVDVDAADVLGVEACFVRDRADDVAGLHAVGVADFDAEGFEARFRLAQDKGELKRDADPAALAILASATMHTIAIRARAGARRSELRGMARKAVDVICGSRR